MECTTLTTECVTTVYTAGFFLTLSGWALGFTIGVAISAIRKL